MRTNHTPETLIAFEDMIAEDYEKGLIRYPVHLSSGGEAELIEIFKKVRPQDWVFSYWRSHYHCLLKGVSPERMRRDIREGRSIAMCYPEYRIFSTAVVGGQIPEAVGVALSIKRRKEITYVSSEHQSNPLPRAYEIDSSSLPLEAPGYIAEDEQVWCFVGDMTARTGACFEAASYAHGHSLPIHFVIEDNGRSVVTDTRRAWGEGSVFDHAKEHLHAYDYEPRRPHSGIGKWIDF